MEVESREGYYAVLGVSLYSSDDEIRRAYRKLAMQWHPDKWNASPSLVDMAKHRFQQIQEAYSVLSDRTKRTLYDAGMFDEEDEGFSDFVQEMMSLVDDVREEEKTYSIEELEGMFWEMAKAYEIPQWTTNSSTKSKQAFINRSIGMGCGSGF
ncbi:chaperone protein DnaJ 2-like [Salvia hispanica]|uniref:chaperone protein DnaJ 2-like n=1 Tax=Salvia hispanica TaxID=49212 RepID=UPI0020091707|nr:chaperone protein DnaJ 2-like [Salvia hispanica]